MNRLPLSVVIVLGLLYIVSPLDVLPDVIPFLGWLDDIGVLGYLGYCVLNRPEEIETK